jgi:two-component system response regulator NreC
MPTSSSDRPTQATTVVLADDHAVMRSGLRLLLDAEPDLEVVAVAGDVAETLRVVAGHKPDVLILDLNMPGGPSLAAIPELRERSPGTQIVVLTMQREPAYAREALRAGAIGYVLKAAADTELVEAVRAAAQGRGYLNPELAASAVASALPERGEPGHLSERELEILVFIAHGHTNPEIAAQLVISVRTVESHRLHILQKLQRSSRAELVRYALDHGLIQTSV